MASQTRRGESQCDRNSASPKEVSDSGFCGIRRPSERTKVARVDWSINALSQAEPPWHRGQSPATRHKKSRKESPSCVMASLHQRKSPPSFDAQCSLVQESRSCPGACSVNKPHNRALHYFSGPTTVTGPPPRRWWLL